MKVTVAGQSPETEAHRVRVSGSTRESIHAWRQIKFKLTVNTEKSAVGRPWKRQFLGYSVCNRKWNVRLKVSKQSAARLKAMLKAGFCRG